MLAPMIPQARASTTPKAVQGCSQKAVQHTRELASARAVKLKTKCQAAHKAASVLNYYRHAGHWQVAPAYKHWWNLPDAKWRLMVRWSRKNQRNQRSRLVQLQQQIKSLLPKPRPKVNHDWLYSTFLCIHGGEGSWNANTGNGYYGGLQMDRAFMRTYGADYLERWGTADAWPPWAQIKAAERAYRSGRGFYPWPNTARACGLI